MVVNTLQLILPIGKIVEHGGNGGMVHRATVFIGHQILLADISDIAAVRIFGEQMIERLILCRAYMFRDRVIPFVTICKYGINIEHHAAEIENPVPHHSAHAKASPRYWRSIERLRPTERMENMRHTPESRVRCVGTQAAHQSIKPGLASRPHCSKRAQLHQHGEPLFADLLMRRGG